MVLYKIQSGVIGHAVGDALGVPVEFKKREALATNPVTGMRSFGSHHVPAGTWSDDTSMEIALMASISEKKSLDYGDVMAKFSDWLYNGQFTATGMTFDFGSTCNAAISNFKHGATPMMCGLTGERDNGNGSLMRILPVAYICYSHNLSDKDTYTLVKNVSSLTHAHEISVLGCYIYVQFARFLLMGMSPDVAYENTRNVDYSMFQMRSLDVYHRILDGDISLLNISEISSRGYVVSSLEAALWCFLNSVCYENAVLTAVNLGDDTDTVGAITGSMAGIYYGLDGIPDKWIEMLQNRRLLIEVCGAFAETLPKIRL